MAAMPLLIKETPPESPHIKHDQLYKELISTFFQEFLDVFFPEVHKHINFQRIKPLYDYPDETRPCQTKTNLRIFRKLFKTNERRGGRING